jgi:tripartite-type tricarboxylate transporter receptor subunit TctC
MASISITSSVRSIMRFSSRQFLRLAVGVVSLAIAFFGGQPAWSQAGRTIRIIVPFPPGGPADFLARVLAEQMGHAQGANIVVENRPGAGSVVGTDAASRAAPDGNTLLVYSKEAVINPHVRKVSYDPLTSFQPICRLVASPTVFSVNSASPYRSLAELFEAAHAKPGVLTLAASGPASPFQIGFEVLKRAANANMTFVPFPGGAPAINALLGGHVTATFSTYSIVSEHVKAGNLRVLASASRVRPDALLNVPTVQELGHPDYEVDIWYGLVAPARTPKEIISKLAEWSTAAMRVPDVRAKLSLQGLDPAPMCGADFGALLNKQYEEYGRIIREANITAE